MGSAGRKAQSKRMQLRYKPKAQAKKFDSATDQTKLNTNLNDNGKLSDHEEKNRVIYIRMESPDLSERNHVDTLSSASSGSQDNGKQPASNKQQAESYNQASISPRNTPSKQARSSDSISSSNSSTYSSKRVLEKSGTDQFLARTCSSQESYKQKSNLSNNPSSFTITEVYEDLKRVGNCSVIQWYKDHERSASFLLNNNLDHAETLPLNKNKILYNDTTTFDQPISVYESNKPTSNLSASATQSKILEPTMNPMCSSGFDNNTAFNLSTTSSGATLAQHAPECNCTGPPSGSVYNQSSIARSLNLLNGQPSASSILQQHVFTDLNAELRNRFSNNSTHSISRDIHNLPTIDFGSVPSKRTRSVCSETSSYIRDDELMHDNTSQVTKIYNASISSSIYSPSLTASPKSVEADTNITASNASTIKPIDKSFHSNDSYYTKGSQNLSPRSLKNNDSKYSRSPHTLPGSPKTASITPANVEFNEAYSNSKTILSSSNNTVSQSGIRNSISEQQSYCSSFSNARTSRNSSFSTQVPTVSSPQLITQLTGYEGYDHNLMDNDFFGIIPQYISDSSATSTSSSALTANFFSSNSSSLHDSSLISSSFVSKAISKNSVLNKSACGDDTVSEEAKSLKLSDTLLNNQASMRSITSGDLLKSGSNFLEQADHCVMEEIAGAYQSVGTSETLPKQGSITASVDGRKALVTTKTTKIVYTTDNWTEPLSCDNVSNASERKPTKSFSNLSVKERAELVEKNNFKCSSSSDEMQDNASKGSPSLASIPHGIVSQTSSKFDTTLARDGRRHYNSLYSPVVNSAEIDCSSAKTYEWDASASCSLEQNVYHIAPSPKLATYYDSNIKSALSFSTTNGGYNSDVSRSNSEVRPACCSDVSSKVSSKETVTKSVFNLPLSQEVDKNSFVCTSNHNLVKPEFDFDNSKTYQPKKSKSGTMLIDYNSSIGDGENLHTNSYENNENMKMEKKTDEHSQSSHHSEVTPHAPKNSFNDVPNYSNNEDLHARCNYFNDQRCLSFSEKSMNTEPRIQPNNHSVTQDYLSSVPTVDALSHVSPCDRKLKSATSYSNYSGLSGIASLSHNALSPACVGSYSSPHGIRVLTTKTTYRESENFDAASSQDQQNYYERPSESATTISNSESDAFINYTRLLEAIDRFWNAIKQNDEHYDPDVTPAISYYLPQFHSSNCLSSISDSSILAVSQYSCEEEFTSSENMIKAPYLSSMFANKNGISGKSPHEELLEQNDNSYSQLMQSAFETSKNNEPYEFDSSQAFSKKQLRDATSVSNTLDQCQKAVLTEFVNFTSGFKQGISFLPL